MGAVDKSIHIKTRMCVYHQSGYCVHGSDCNYAHTEAELKPLDPKMQVRACRYWPAGQCKAGSNCPLAHIGEPVSPVIRSANASFTNRKPLPPIIDTQTPTSTSSGPSAETPSVAALLERIRILEEEKKQAEDQATALAAILAQQMLIEQDTGRRRRLSSDLVMAGFKPRNDSMYGKLPSDVLDEALFID